MLKKWNITTPKNEKCTEQSALFIYNCTEFSAILVISAFKCKADGILA